MSMDKIEKLNKKLEELKTQFLEGDLTDTQYYTAVETWKRFFK